MGDSLMRPSIHLGKKIPSDIYGRVQQVYYIKFQAHSSSEKLLGCNQHHNLLTSQCWL